MKRQIVTTMYNKRELTVGWRVSTGDEDSFLRDNCPETKIQLQKKAQVCLTKEVNTTL